jgi:probable HAF family extracellular repeat protein
MSSRSGCGDCTFFINSRGEIFLSRISQGQRGPHFISEPDIHHSGVISRGVRAALSARRHHMLCSRKGQGFNVEQLERRSLLSAYALTDLGSFGGGKAEAFDINNAGQVVGYAVTAANQRHAFLWQNGVMRDLGTTPSAANRSEAYGVNSTGQVAGGTGSTLQLIAPEAFRWQNGAMAGLGVSNGGQANAINDSGQVAGTDGYNSGYRAFLWQNGNFTYLGSFGTQFQVSLAYDLNNNGTVAGTAATDEILPEFGPLYHAFVWQNGAMTDLGVLPNQTESAAMAINSLGQVVGIADHIEEVTYHELSRKSFLYQNGQLTALNVPGEHNSATDINDFGQIVGFMQTDVGATNNAYIYENGVATDLNNLIPGGSGLHITIANAINNAGQIVGTAVDSAGRPHAVLLNRTRQRISIRDTMLEPTTRANPFASAPVSAADHALISDVGL